MHMDNNNLKRINQWIFRRRKLEGLLKKAAIGFLGVLAMWGTAELQAAESLLWSIGTPDKSDAEFWGDTGNYNTCPRDAMYLVGVSVPNENWPFMQPGPADSWAGNRNHSNWILFCLGNVPKESEGNYFLRLYLKNSHKDVPPRLVIRLNGKLAGEVQLMPGQGDDLVQGKVKEVIGSKVDVSVNPTLLKKGENILEIATEGGSWLYYDAVEFWSPQEAKLTLPGDHQDGRLTRLIGIEEYGVLLRDPENPTGKKALAPIGLRVAHVGREFQANLFFDQKFLSEIKLTPGGRVYEVKLPYHSSRRKGVLSLKSQGGEVLFEEEIMMPQPKLEEFYLFPHSHVDIGYTHRQDEVVDLQIENMNISLGLIQKSEEMEPSARFKWNPESLWVVDHYLNRESEENKELFLEKVQEGSVSLDALYGNLLTGLCRPEELYRGIAYFAGKYGELTGKPIISAAICDVPGYTWGVVPMMGQAGIKYFAIAPNYSDRIGRVHAVWDDKPFYWISPSGMEKILCWITGHYWKHGNLENEVLAHLKKRQRSDYPYSLEWMYWIATRDNGQCDNSPPDTNLSAAVEDWNQKYLAPKLIIGTSKEFFPKFEKRYGDQLPEYRGDMTPYWEDGAGSTSAETGMNRRSADKLSQAETLWAILAPEKRPAEKLEEAWKNVLLYSEHTWGAYCSISNPDDPFTVSQWERKRQFALDAAAQAESLLKEAVAEADFDSEKENKENGFSVWNTTQWVRTELVKVPAELAEEGDFVLDAAGERQLSQRLSNGDLVFLAREVPPLKGKNYFVSSKLAENMENGPECMPLQVKEEGKIISDKVELSLDTVTGAIRELRFTGEEHNFVDPDAPVGLNDYRYLKGVDPSKAQVNGQVKIEIAESGPLVGALRVSSAAPGCVELIREIRLVSGSPRVEIINFVNREVVREKDAVHIGFGFNIPNGQLRMETPWAVVRPNYDQLPGSCYNWYTVQRWVDISNRDIGILWGSVDAPLMEIGGLTANLLGSVSLDEWMNLAYESQTLYSWAQNNHWHTNYKADQPGVTVFVYFLEPYHGEYEGERAARFGQETTRPLVVVPGITAEEQERELCLPVLEWSDFALETLKVSEDGKAYIYRLQNMAPGPRVLELWQRGEEIYQTDLSEKPLKKLHRSVTVPAYGILNLRVER